MPSDVVAADAVATNGVVANAMMTVMNAPAMETRSDCYRVMMVTSNWVTFVLDAT